LLDGHFRLPAGRGRQWILILRSPATPRRVVDKFNTYHTLLKEQDLPYFSCSSSELQRWFFQPNPIVFASN